MIDLSIFSGKNICVAVSGGRDSMALVNYIYTHVKDYDVTLSVINCDHRIRGEASARDSVFVRDWCSARSIPLFFFEWDSGGAKTEALARIWRHQCYKKVLETGIDYVLTAHHIEDNAETVLFNLARGTSLSGMCGITDSDRIIRPLIACTRAQIDDYIRANGVPYVDDMTNFTDDYTRNKIRHNIIPELERAVPGAVKNIYRFSRLAAEDEAYFNSLISERGILTYTPVGAEIKHCESVIFKRAAVIAIKHFNKIDYTAEHLERLFALKDLPAGKKFEFLGLTAYAGRGKIVLTEQPAAAEIPFACYADADFCGQPLTINDCAGEGKALRFDCAAIPDTATIRFARTGDKFTKFGGGTKSLGDYFTDKKIPLWARQFIPLIADANDVLAVCGVEISDKIKVTDKTKTVKYITCIDYTKL